MSLQRPRGYLMNWRALAALALAALVAGCAQAPQGEPEAQREALAVPSQAPAGAQVGEWVNGSLVDLRLVEVLRLDAGASSSWRYTVEAAWHNGSTPTTVDLILGSEGARMTPGALNQTWEGARYAPVAGWPLAQAAVSTEEGQVDTGLYQWFGATR